MGAALGEPVETMLRYVDRTEGGVRRVPPVTPAGVTEREAGPGRELRTVP